MVATLESAKSRIMSLETSLLQKDEVLNSTQAECEKLSAAVKLSEESQSVLGTKLAEKERAFSEYSSLVVSLKRALSEHNAISNNLRSSTADILADSERKFVEASTENERLEQELILMHEDLSARLDEVSTLRSNLSGLLEERDMLVEESNRRIFQLEGDMSVLTALIVELEDEKEAWKHREGDYSQEIGRLRAELVEAEATIAQKSDESQYEMSVLGKVAADEVAKLENELRVALDVSGKSFQTLDYAIDNGHLSADLARSIEENDRLVFELNESRRSIDTLELTIASMEYKSQSEREDLLSKLGASIDNRVNEQQRGSLALRSALDKSLEDYGNLKIYNIVRSLMLIRSQSYG